MKNIRFDNVLLSCVALGCSSVYNAGKRKHHFYLLQFLIAEIWRRYCRGCHDNSEHCDAVCHAADAGSCARRSADLQLQLWCSQISSCQADLSTAFDLLLYLFRIAVGCCAVISAGFASLFTSDTAMVAYTKSALRIYAGAIFIMGVQIACQMTFISLGNAKTSIFVAVFRKFIMLVPLIYLLPMCCYLIRQ